MTFQFGFRWSEGLVGVLRLDMLHHVRPTRKSVVEVIEVKHIRTHTCCVDHFVSHPMYHRSVLTIFVHKMISEYKWFITYIYAPTLNHVGYS